MVTGTGGDRGLAADGAFDEVRLAVRNGQRV